MKKWLLLETVTTPDGQELRLFEHDGDYAMRLRGVELMSTRQKASEQKLAEVGCIGLREKKEAQILIGGLGFGFTLRAVLSYVAKDANILVSELMPAVVQWNSNPAYPFGAQSMQDSRVEVRVQNVSEIIEKATSSFDAILLDVDNGPSALTHAANQNLYTLAGVKRLHKALRMGGRACIWSVGDDKAFSQLLLRTGFQVETVQTRTHDTSGGSRTIFIAGRC